MNLPELGVGLTWFAGLEPVLDENAGLIDLLEIEPQSFWRRQSSTHALVIDQPSLQSLRDRPMPKLIHSVALPVGGTHAPHSSELGLLRHFALELDVPWLSEHPLLKFIAVIGVACSAPSLSTGVPWAAMMSARFKPASDRDSPGRKSSASFTASNPAANARPCRLVSWSVSKPSATSRNAPMNSDRAAK